MNRKDFFKKLGIGLGVAVVVPRVLAEIPSKEEGESLCIVHSSDVKSIGTFVEAHYGNFESCYSFTNIDPTVMGELFRYHKKNLFNG